MTDHAALIAKLEAIRQELEAESLRHSYSSAADAISEAIAALQATPDVKTLEHELESLRTVVGHDAPIIGMSENEVRHIAGFQRDLRGLFQRQARESRQQVEKAEAQLAAQRTALQGLAEQMRAGGWGAAPAPYWANRLAAILQAAPTAEDGQ